RSTSLPSGPRPQRHASSRAAHRAGPEEKDGRPPSPHRPPFPCSPYRGLGRRVVPWPASWRRSASGSGWAKSPSTTRGARGETRARSCRVADRMSLYERALTRMEALAAASTEGDTPWGPDRNLVSRETAADAVMDVFATLDALRQGVELPPNRIEHTFAV